MTYLELSTFYERFSQNILPDRHTIGHFNIFKVENLLLPKRKNVHYSRRSFYKVSLITGHSRVHYADHTVEENGTLLLFTNPIIPFFWERVEEPHTGYICVFTEDFFSRFENIREYPIFQFPGAGVIRLSMEEGDRYAQMFADMLAELNGDYTYKYDLLRNKLMEVIHGAQKMQPAGGVPLNGSNAFVRITGLFGKLLDRQFPIELTDQTVRVKTPSDFAKQLNIHVNHLNKALKEVTGRTTTEWINARLLQEARVLLKSTDWTINEIAWCLGFEEPNHFSSFFKNKTQITPKEFRQSLRD